MNPLSPNHASATLTTEFVSILATLIREPSVVGAEHSFFRTLQRELEERGARVTWYEGLLVAQGNKPDSIYLSAHVDRHGLICAGPNEFQYAAFVAGSRSDLLGNSVSEQLMRKIVDRFLEEDVYAYEPWSGAYRGKGRIHKAYICEYRNNLIFDIEGLEHLVAGTPVAFTDKLKISGAEVSGQLDNVLSVAVLVYLFECGFQGTAFFTAQEEAGRSWRYLLEWFRRFGGRTNQLIVADTSPFPDFQSVSEQHLVLRNKDANASFNTALTQKLLNACSDLGYKTLFKDHYVEETNRTIQNENNKLSYGSTELGRIIAASNGLVDGTTLQVPSSAYHTMNETAHVDGIAAFIDVLHTLSQLS